MKDLVSVGIIVILVGFALTFIGALQQSKEQGTAKVTFGGFIGPIPFGFGNDKNFLYIAMAIAFLFFLFWFVLSRKLIG